jgi:hypothetical protein
MPTTIYDPLTGASMTIGAANKAGRIEPFDSAGNSLSKTQGQANLTTQGGILTAVNNDSNARLSRGDRFGGTASALHQPLFMPDLEGTTINAAHWIATLTTTTMTQVTGLITVTGVSTATTGGMLVSNKKFKKSSRALMQAKTRMAPRAFPNTIEEWGYGIPPTQTTVQIPNGAFFRLDEAGVLKGVFALAGADVNTVALPVAGFSASTNTNYFTYDILLDDDEARFIVQDTSTELIVAEGTIRLPLGASRIWADSHLPVFYRQFNLATTAGGIPTMLISDPWMVTVLDANYLMPAPALFSSAGLSLGHNPQSGAQLLQWVNSAEPASATLSNTVAGYNALHGKWQFAAPAGAPTDYLLFALTTPLNSHQLVITDIIIDAWNTGAASATTPTLLEWFVAYNGTAASLATATHIREYVGSQSFPVAAAIGQMADRSIQRTFNTPIVNDAGKFFGIAVRIPVGTATASQVVAGAIALRGFAY